jgi:hypothetical protein
MIVNVPYAVVRQSENRSYLEVENLACETRIMRFITLSQHASNLETLQHCITFIKCTKRYAMQINPKRRLLTP